MKYELNSYNRNVNENDLIKDLRRIATALNSNYVSRSDYESKGNYSATPFINRFGSWIKSLEIAGLCTERPASDYHRISDKELLEDIKNAAISMSKNTVTSTEYTKFGKFKVQTILTRFDNWDSALKQADLIPTGFSLHYTDLDLFNEIEDIWIKLGRQPTTSDIKKGISKISLNTYTRRFGGWRNALELFVKYINEETSPEEIEKIVDEAIGVLQTEKDKVKIRKLSRRTNRDINLRLRFKVLQRDNFKCRICGISPAIDPTVILHVNHIFPWVKGGETELENLQSLCSKCNLGKSDL